jgi:hypothetical protein
MDDGYEGISKYLSQLTNIRNFFIIQFISNIV